MRCHIKVIKTTYRLKESKSIASDELYHLNGQTYISEQVVHICIPTIHFLPPTHQLRPLIQYITPLLFYINLTSFSPSFPPSSQHPFYNSSLPPPAILSSHMISLFLFLLLPPLKIIAMSGKENKEREIMPYFTLASYWPR